MVRKGEDGDTIWFGNWWIGHGLDEEGNDITTPIPPELRETVAKKLSLLIIHNHREVPHLNEMIKDLYVENKDKPLDQD